MVFKDIEAFVGHFCEERDKARHIKKVEFIFFKSLLMIFFSDSCRHKWHCGRQMHPFNAQTTHGAFSQ
jgi:hypothetical protein